MIHSKDVESLSENREACREARRHSSVLTELEYSISDPSHASTSDTFAKHYHRYHAHLGSVQGGGDRHFQMTGKAITPMYKDMAFPPAK